MLAGNVCAFLSFLAKRKNNWQFFDFAMHLFIVGFSRKSLLSAGSDNLLWPIAGGNLGGNGRTVSW